VVVSRSDRPGNDVVLAFIKSYRGVGLVTTDLLVESTHPDFAQTGLKTGSVIKLDKLLTVETSILLGELGALSAGLLRQADAKLRYALEV